MADDGGDLDFPAAVKRGWLDKSDKTGSKWRRRYCALLGPVLGYFEDLEMTKQKGQVDVASATIKVGRPSSWPPGRVAPSIHLFTLETDTRSFYFAAKTEREVMEWVEVLEEAGRQAGLKRKPKSFRYDVDAALARSQRRGLAVEHGGLGGEEDEDEAVGQHRSEAAAAWPRGPAGQASPGRGRRAGPGTPGAEDKIGFVVCAPRAGRGGERRIRMVLPARRAARVRVKAIKANLAKKVQEIDPKHMRLEFAAEDPEELGEELTDEMRGEELGLSEGTVLRLRDARRCSLDDHAGDGDARGAGDSLGGWGEEAEEAPALPAAAAEESLSGAGAAPASPPRRRGGAQADEAVSHGARFAEAGDDFLGSAEAERAAAAAVREAGHAVDELAGPDHAGGAMDDHASAPAAGAAGGGAAGGLLSPDPLARQLAARQQQEEVKAAAARRVELRLALLEVFQEAAQAEAQADGAEAAGPAVESQHARGPRLAALLESHPRTRDWRGAEGLRAQLEAAGDAPLAWRAVVRLLAGQQDVIEAPAEPLATDRALPGSPLAQLAGSGDRSGGGAAGGAEAAAAAPAVSAELLGALKRAAVVSGAVRGEAEEAVLSERHAMVMTVDVRPEEAGTIVVRAGDDAEHLTRQFLDSFGLPHEEYEGALVGEVRRVLVDACVRQLHAVKLQRDDALAALGRVLRMGRQQGLADLDEREAAAKAGLLPPGAAAGGGAGTGESASAAGLEGKEGEEDTKEPAAPPAGIDALVARVSELEEELRRAERRAQVARSAAESATAMAARQEGAQLAAGAEAAAMQPVVQLLREQVEEAQAEAREAVEALRGERAAHAEARRALEARAGAAEEALAGYEGVSAEAAAEASRSEAVKAMTRSWAVEKKDLLQRANTDRAQLVAENRRLRQMLSADPASEQLEAQFRSLDEHRATMEAELASSQSGRQRVEAELHSVYAQWEDDGKAWAAEKQRLTQQIQALAAAAAAAAEEGARAAAEAAAAGAGTSPEDVRLKDKLQAATRNWAEEVEILSSMWRSDRRRWATEAASIKEQARGVAEEVQALLRGQASTDPLRESLVAARSQLDAMQRQLEAASAVGGPRVAGAAKRHVSLRSAAGSRS